MRQGKRHITHYTYDSTNQLVSAANPQTYALSVTYGDWGKIQQYGLQQTDLTNNVTTSQTRTYSYGSLNEGQTTFAPNNISYADGTNVNEQYGINGSLLRRETTIPNAQPNEELYRFGADGNLRMYSYDRLFYSLYGYDGGTTRTYKYSFDLNPNWVNGRLENVIFNPHTAMFYPNSYLNFNQDGYYTKHYYNGMERIASRLGDQNLQIHTNDPELQDRKDQLDSNIRRNIADITGYEFLPVGEEQTIDDPKPVFELPQVGLNNLTPNTSSVYYYHPNHLGSTCYVTDENAIVQQGFLYAPFGEITNEYNSTFGNNLLPKYSFNAKELDEETGMYYYEARYMAPPVFISRDPLFEKYPTFSPYAYCANNPVKYVDPDGRDIWDVNEETGKVTRTKDKTKDVIRIVDNEGNVINDVNGTPQILTYDYGTVNHYTTKKNGYDIFRIRDDKKGTAIFELMANNTNVEWTHFKTGQSGDKGLNFITTSHSPDKEDAGTHLYNKQLMFKYYIREHIHNHPTGIPVPSGMPGTRQEGEGDISIASQINSNSKFYGYKLPSYKVYMKGYGYNEYSANSQVSDFENIYKLFGIRPKMK